MLHKMLQTIDRYQMLEPQQRVVVGFSGGADSTALLFALHRLEQQLDIRVEACHINHCLRGEESERDQQFCTDFCKRYNIPLTVHRIWAQQEAKQAGQSVETFSRQRRYQLLTALAGQQGRVATAHNCNDNAETVLFYLARGTGLNGLGGIPLGARADLSVPLIARTREQIEQFCRGKWVGLYPRFQQRQRPVYPQPHPPSPAAADAAAQRRIFAEYRRTV